MNAPSERLPGLVVVYDQGAATLLEILGAARGLCDVTFAFDAEHNEHVRDLLPFFARVPSLDLSGMPPEAAAEAVGALRPGAVITYSANQIARTADLNTRLGLRGHPADAVAGLVDKFEQRRIIAEAGGRPVAALPVRDSLELDRAVASLGLPVVLKPRVGAGSQGVRRLETPAQVAAAGELLDRADEAGAGHLVEELLVGDPAVAGPSWGDYVSVESWVDGDTVVPLGVTGKFPLAEPFRELGAVVPATVPAAVRAQCEQVAEQAVRALRVTTGLVHTELKLTASGPRIIEVNPRLGGGLVTIYRDVYGVDLARTAMLNALGHEPPEFGEPAGAAFWYMILPPVGARSFRHMNGADELRRLPGVRSMEILKNPGDRLDAFEGSVSNVITLYARADDHADVLASCRRILRTVEVDWAF